MHFKLYKDVRKFHEDTHDILMCNEAQNFMILGHIKIGCDGKDKAYWRDPVNWVMATVSDEDNILIVALMTPPHNITLYARGNIVNLKAIRCLVDGLKDYEIPGVMTEKSLAESFAKEYTTRRSLAYEVEMNQRIYELRAVDSSVKQFGRVRLVEEKDMTFFPYWVGAFDVGEANGCTKMNIPKDADWCRYRISTKEVYVLECNQIPVSMAGYMRETETAIGIALVYTPPCFRGKGYATSCVAQLSQMALDRGIIKCVLYTDLSNPISNSIYQKIGYRPVCDSFMLKFKGGGLKADLRVDLL